MPRTSRITVAKTPHHVFHRTMKGRVLFYTDQDRIMFLSILKEQANRHKTDILAYCLMRDCFNLIAVPKRQDGLAKTIGRTCFSYARYLSKRRPRNSSLWRNRFQSCALDEEYLKIAARYVEMQPVYERLVRKAEKYAWSSAKSHMTGKDEHEVLALDVWPATRLRNKWANFLSQKLGEPTREKLRSFTQTGRPIGSKPFIDKLEKKFRRRLHPLPIGRPPLEG